MYPNNTPQWAPSRPLVTADPGKLSYFAKANYTRAGLNAGMAAATGAEAFSGVRLAGFGNAAVNRIEQTSPAVGGSQPTGSGRDVSMPGAGQSVADFTTRLSSAVSAFFGGQAPVNQQPQVVLPDAGPLGIPVGGWILAGVAVVGIGFLILKK